MSQELKGNNIGKGLLTIAFLIIVVLVIALAPGPTAARNSGRDSFDLDDTAWNLLSINGEDVLPGSHLTLQFAEGKIAGSAGVNNYFASYEVEGGALSVGPAGSTMMMGPEELMAQEWTFLSTLQSAEFFQVEGDLLEIVYEGGVLLFAAAKWADQ